MNDSQLLFLITVISLCSILIGCSQSNRSSSNENSEIAESNDSLVYDTAPKWSNSGDKILFYTYRHDKEGAELYTVDPESGELTRLTNTFHNEWWSDYSINDGKIYFSSDKGKSSRFEGSEIFVMNADGTSIEQLTSSLDTTLFNIRPAVSPDGTKIAYCHDCIGKETNSEIILVNSDGSDPVNLTNHPANDRDASWSPDGQQLLFSSNRLGNYELYILDINSGDLKQITNSVYNSTQGDWSVNDEIVFVSDEGGDREIVTMGLDGANKKQLTHNDANDVLPHWSPDGKRIAFSSYRRGNKDKGDIYMIDKEGTNEKLLTKR